jgi:hypothetical protein
LCCLCNFIKAAHSKQSLDRQKIAQSGLTLYPAIDSYCYYYIFRHPCAMYIAANLFLHNCLNPNPSNVTFISGNDFTKLHFGQKKKFWEKKFHKKGQNSWLEFIYVKTVK